MDGPPEYSDEEIAEIERFLRDCVVHATANLQFARPVDAAKQARPEVERLRKTRKSGRKKIALDDVQELEEALQGPFAPVIRSTREEDLKQIQLKNPPGVGIGMFFLKHFSTRLCASLAPTSSNPATALISAGGLALLLHQVQIPPIYAPAIVWLATMVRNEGLPAFCDALHEFLSK